MVRVVVVLLVVQVMVMVRGKVVRVLDIRAAAVKVVHVHYVGLVVLRVVVENGRQVRDGRCLRVGLGVLEGLRERVSGQGPGRGHRQGDAGGASSLSLCSGDRAAIWFVFDGSLWGVSLAASSPSSPFALILSTLSISNRRPPCPVSASSLDP